MTWTNEPHPFSLPPSLPKQPSKDRNGGRSLRLIDLGVALGLTALVTGFYADGHEVRLVSTAVCCVGGAFGAAYLRRRARWYVSAGVLAAGVGLGVLSYWLLPTAKGGPSLWGATRAVAALEAVAPGDRAGFAERLAESKDAVKRFPSLKSRAIEAESAWMDRTARTALVEANNLRDTDPVRAIALLRELEGVPSVHWSESLPRMKRALAAGRKEVVEARLRAASRELDGFLAARQYVEALRLAERLHSEWHDEAVAARLDATLAEAAGRIAEQAVDGAVVEAKELAARDPGEASARLRALAGLPKALERSPRAVHQLTEARREVFVLGLQAGLKECAALAAEKKYDEAARRVGQVAATWRDEAEGIAAQADLQKFRTRGALAVVTPQAEAALALLPDDPAGAVTRLRQIEEALPPGLIEPEVVAPLVEGRRQAVRAAIQRADREREALLARKDSAGLERLKERVVKAWEAEASARGLAGDLTAFGNRCALAGVEIQATEIETRLAGDPLRASVEVQKLANRLPPAREYPEGEKSLRDVRGRLLQRGLDAGRKECAALTDAKKYAEASLTLDRTAKAWGDEAVTLGRQDALTEFRKQTALTILKPQLEAATNDDLVASVKLVQKLDRDLPKELDLPAVRDRLRERRREIVVAAVKKADTERTELTTAKKFAELAALLEQTRSAWESEARSAGLLDELNAFGRQGALALLGPQVAEAEALTADDPAKASMKLRQLARDLPTSQDFPAVRQLLDDARRRALRAAMAAGARECRRLVAADKAAELRPLAARLTDAWGKEASAVGLEAELQGLCERILFLADLAGAKK
jgi:hypothetical protein